MLNGYIDARLGFGWHDRKRIDGAEREQNGARAACKYESIYLLMAMVATGEQLRQNVIVYIFELQKGLLGYMR